MTVNLKRTHKGEAWSTKVHGEPLTQALLDLVGYETNGVLSPRAGTAMKFAAAMYARPTGATQPECNNATGDSHHDAIRAAKAAGFTMVKTGTRNNHAVYYLTLAAPKAKGKARKAASKRKGAPAVTGEAAPTGEGETA